MAGLVAPGSDPMRPGTALRAGCLAAGLLLCGQAGWIHAKAAVAQVLLRRAFAETVATGRVVKPWSSLDSWPVARIEVPRLGRSLIALEGGSGQALAFGPAHVAGTPEAGRDGTAVYAAHRDTQFTFLGQLQPGDRIVVARRDGVRVAFRVVGREVRRWDRSGIDPTAPGSHLVLSTCWPLDALTPGPLRLLVHADAETPAPSSGLLRG